MFPLLLAACAIPVEHTTTDVSTVPKIVWEAGVSAHVEYGLTDAYGEATPTVDSGAVLLRGLRPETTYHYRLVLDGGRASDDQTLTTGSLPNDLPQLVWSGEASDGFTFTSVMGTSNTAVVVDGAGSVVWYRSLGEETRSMRVRPSLDGTGIYLNTLAHPDRPNTVTRVGWDGVVQEVFTLPEHSHDFTELPDGDLAVIVLDRRTVGEEVVKGDALVRVSADGDTEELWNAWDALDPPDKQAKAEPTGWTHANSVSHLDDGGFLLSLRNLNAILLLGEDGSIRWQLGGDNNDFTFADGGRPPVQQHQPHLNGDVLTVFDNRNAAPEASRVASWALDTDSWEATEVRSLERDLDVYAMGEALVLDDGGLLVSWSTSGILERRAADESLRWELQSALGYAFGFIVHEDELY